MVEEPTDSVTVHDPEDGRPLKATLLLPKQVGCVMVPTTGAVGTAFTVAVTAVLEVEIHPVVVFLACA